MTDANLDLVASVLDTCADMTIATLGADGAPEASTVSFVSDGTRLWFGTSRSSRKAANIARDNRISLTVNRPYRFWKDIVGVSLAGRATCVSEPPEYREVEKRLHAKFPEIHEYAAAENEDIALFRIDADVIRLLDYSRGFGHSVTVEL